MIGLLKKIRHSSLKSKKATRKVLSNRLGQTTTEYVMILLLVVLIFIRAKDALVGADGGGGIIQDLIGKVGSKVDENIDNL